MSFGVTAAGFVPKTLQDIKTELEAAFRAEFGESIDLAPESVFGQLIGVMAERYADLWDLGEAIDAQYDPDSATDAGLEHVCAITGTVRDAATYSAVTVTVTGTPTTVLNTGRTMSVASTGKKFDTTAAGTIAAATAWVAGTTYTAGDRRTNASNIYRCRVGGTAAGSGGPTDTTRGVDIVDNGAVWRFVGVGTGFADIAAQAQDTGPVIAITETLTGIETPVAGWSGVSNTLDATPGVDTELDADLRARREAELRISGDAAVDAIRSKVLQVPDVTACTVFQNSTNITDADGLPPKSVEVMVRGGTDAAVRAAVFASVAGGIETYGTTSGTVSDATGNSHTVKFSRPGDLNIWVILNVLTQVDVFPLDGSDQIKARVVAMGNTYATGKDAVSAAVSAQAFGVAGVLDVTSCLIGLVNPPTLPTTVAVNLRQLARFDTSRITVNVSTGTP